MRNVLIALASSILLYSVPAIAADMPIKAPLRNNLLTYPAYDGAGFYWGISTEAGVAQSKVDNTFVGGLINGNMTAAGAGVGGTIGYMRGNGSYWLAGEASVHWQNITASDPANVTVASRWSAEQSVKLGGFQQFLSWLPDLGLGSLFPTLPTPPTPPGFNLAANTSHTYIKAGMEEFGLTASVLALNSGHEWAAAPLVGMGVLNQLLNKDGTISTAVLDVGAQVTFADKGFTFGSGGLGGSAKLGRQYKAYAKILW